MSHLKEKSSRLLGIIFLKFYKIHFQLLASNEVAESFAQFFNAASFKMNNKLDHMTRAIHMEADMQNFIQLLLIMNV